MVEGGVESETRDDRFALTQRVNAAWWHEPVADPSPEAATRHHLKGLVLGLRQRLRRHYYALVTALRDEEAFGHVFLLYPVSMIAGVVLWFSLPEEGHGVELLSWTTLLLLAGWSTRYAQARVRYPVRLLLFMALGAVSAEVQIRLTETVVIDSPVTTIVTARVRAVEMRGPTDWRYTLDILETERPKLKRPPTGALLGVRGASSAFHPGDVIAGMARLQPPAGPALPGLNDFAFDSYFKGIGAIGGFLGQPHLVEQGDADQIPALLAARDWLATLRVSIDRRIADAIPGDAGAFATALVTNDAAALSKPTFEALRISGLAHVISISGLHMVLAAGIFYVGVRSVFSLFPRFIQTRPAKKYAAAGAIVTSFLYLMISGAPVPAARSFIMLFMALGGVLAERPVLTMRSVAIAVFAVVIITPASILGASFQMSFAAAAALVSAYALWRLKPAEFSRLRGLPLYGRLLPVIRAVGGVMLTSEIAGFATAIFSVAHFQRLTLLGMLGNVAAMPFISFIVMPAGFLAMLLMPFGLEALPLYLMGKGLEATIAIAYGVAGLGGDITTGELAAWVLPLASIAFVAAILPRTRLLRLVGVASFAVVLLGVVAFGRVPKPDILVSETGDMVALRVDGALAVNVLRPPSFVMDQWTRAVVATSVNKPQPIAQPTLERREKRQPLTDKDEWATEDAMEAAAKTVAANSFVCAGRDWCMGRMANGLLIATFNNFAFQGSACRQADIVVAAARLREPRCGADEALLIDRETLRQRGALAIYVAKGGQAGAPLASARNLTIVGAMDGQNRPWNMHRFYDWRKNSYDGPFEPAEP